MLVATQTHVCNFVFRDCKFGLDLKIKFRLEREKRYQTDNFIIPYRSPCCSVVFMNSSF